MQMRARTVGRKRRSTTRLRWGRSLVAVLTLAVAIPLLGTTSPAAAIANPVEVTSPLPPTTATKASPYGTHQFTADGPVGNWRVRSGSLPPGLALDPVTGVLSGTPTRGGVFGPITVAATDRRLTFESNGAVTCGLHTDGSARCWGGALSGQDVDQPGPFTTIGTGQGHVCGLRPDGSAHCWGRNDRGQARGQEGPFTAITGGIFFTCALRVDGSAHCWGKNDFGESTDQPGPYTAISSGHNHTCALRPDGSAHCWGHNLWGQSEDQAGPFTAISSTASYSCGLRTDGSVKCWGAISSDGVTDRPGPYTALATGSFHACGLRPDGAAHCWGGNDYGEATGRLGPFTAIAAGHYYSCGMRADGSVVCWGLDNSGQTIPKPGPYVSGLDVSQTFSIEVTSMPPAIAPIADQTIDRDSTTGPLSVIVGDEDDLPSSLVVSAASSDQAVVPDAGVTLAGTGALRTVAVTPAAGATGTATITLTVTDPDGLTASTSFTVHVVGESTTLAGTVALGGDGVDRAIVAAYEDGDGFSPTAAALTGTDGTYLLGDLPPGTYRLAVLAPSPTGTSVAWWSDAHPHGAASRASATPIEIGSSPMAHTGLDVDLVPAAAVSGTVTDTSGSPLAGVSVRAWAPTDAWLPTAATTTGADGTYTLDGLAAGDYRIQFVPAAGSPLRPTWHPGTADAATATVHALTPGQQLGGIDAELTGAAVIAGTVTDAGGTGIAGASVLAFRETNRFMPTATATTRPDGTFAVGGLPAGSYRLLVVPPTGSELPNTWHGGATRATATPLTVTPDDHLAGVEITLTP